MSFVTTGAGARTLLIFALGMAGCATHQNPATGGALSAGAAPMAVKPGQGPGQVVGATPMLVPAAYAAPPADPNAPRPFTEVIKGAMGLDGLFPVWRKDDKVWIEVPRSAFNKPFLFTANVASSVGERGLYASQMGMSQLVEWRQIGHQVQLVALNTDFRGEGEGKRAVEQGFSPSLLAAGTAASLEHPERHSVLVDAGMFLTDILGITTHLELVYRLQFGVDRSNSYFEAGRTEAKLSTLTARLHYYTPRIPAPPLVQPGGMPVPVPTPPQTVPDPRSLFMSIVYNFQALPAKAMAPRLADPRLGFFTESFTDLGSTDRVNPRVHYIKRWRLEKKDPDAELSEPVQPIVYWLDRNIPRAYRASVEAGVLEWNKAFERIGFKNAIQVRQQPDDADFDTMDTAHAAIRWYVGADAGMAMGPSQADPRSGEILDADISLSDVFARHSRGFVVEDMAPPRAALQRNGTDTHCEYASEVASEMDFALDMLAARGELEPDSPQAEAFVQAVIKDTVMHEVGHTLGLKHNFKASTTVSQQQLRDKAWTDVHGISGSVMDYNAFNIALEGEEQGNFTNTTLGPYDYWAIEYAYKPLPAGQELEALRRIAERSSEPALAYGDDTDAGAGVVGGLDPLVNRFDLGDDPLAYYERRLKLSQELWARLQARTPKPGEDPLRQRRAFVSGFSQLGRSAELVGKYVGGMYTLRDQPGAGARAAFRPVESGKQRKALKFLATGLFSADSFRFDPEFMARLQVDYNEASRAGPLDVAAAVAAVQSPALERLMSAKTALSLMQLPNYVPKAERKGLITLDEVYGTLQDAIWAELRSGREIDSLRRNLQREYLRHLQGVLTKSNAPAELADAYALMRMHAVALESELKRAVGRKGLSVESRAHLAECLDMLTSVLHAGMQRS